MVALAGKTIVLGVTGGISAYKGAELCRLLRKAGAEVRVVMTKAATAFIAPLTLQTLSGHAVATDLLDPAEEADIGHIRLADDADLVVIAPATADAIARLASGMANDLLTAVVLATRAPVLLAPAMNVNMWENPLTQDNLRRLLALGRVHTVGPDRGELACGWVGAGRLVEPLEIVAEAERLLGRRGDRHALAGRRVVVTAGPTFEALDDVRFVGNRSSGRMGFALAQVAAELGAEVTLIAGPVALSTPPGIGTRLDVESATEMANALGTATREADVVVMAAAVADFRPAERLSGKLSRRSKKGEGMTLKMIANPDLLATLGAARRSTVPLLVGFAAETNVSDEALETAARHKLLEKRCDVIIANDVGREGQGFGSDRNAVLVVDAKKVTPLGPAPKTELAWEIWADLVARLPTQTVRGAPARLRPLAGGRRSAGRRSR